MEDKLCFFYPSSITQEISGYRICVAQMFDMHT